LHLFWPHDITEHPDGGKAKQEYQRRHENECTTVHALHVA
jgi:hypothetical protein